MNHTKIKDLAHGLFKQAPFISHIRNLREHEQALDLMEELLKDYDYNKHLIEMLSITIGQFENESEYFKGFNERTQSLDDCKTIRHKDVWKQLQDA